MRVLLAVLFQISAYSSSFASQPGTVRNPLPELWDVDVTAATTTWSHSILRLQRDGIFMIYGRARARGTWRLDETGVHLSYDELLGIKLGGKATPEQFPDAVRRQARFGTLLHPTGDRDTVNLIDVDVPGLIWHIARKRSDRELVEKSWLLSDDPLRDFAEAELVLRGRECLPELLSTLKSSPRQELRYWATCLIADLDLREAIPNLIKSLADETQGVASGSARALATLKAKEAVTPIIDAIRHGPLDAHSGIEALGNLGGGSAVTFLTDELRSESSFERSSSLEALTKIGDLSVLPNMKKLSDDPSEFVRSALGIALAKLAPNDPLIEKIVSRLILELPTSYSTDKVKIIEAFGAIGDRRAIQPLIDCLDDQDQFVPSFAAWSLGKLRATEAIEPLKRLLSRKGGIFGPAKAAEQALKQIGN